MKIRKDIELSKIPPIEQTDKDYVDNTDLDKELSSLATIFNMFVGSYVVYKSDISEYYQECISNLLNNLKLEIEHLDKMIPKWKQEYEESKEGKKD